MPHTQYLLPCCRDGLDLALIFFFFFFLLLPYLMFLLFTTYPGKKDPLPERSTIIYQFYLGLSAVTLLVTLYSLILLPHYFTAGGILWCLLFSLLIFLFFLGRKDKFRYVIIAEEIPRVPLLMAALTCGVCVLYSVYFIILESIVLLRVGAIEEGRILLGSYKTPLQSLEKNPPGPGEDKAFIPSPRESATAGGSMENPPGDRVEPRERMDKVRRTVISAANDKVTDFVTTPTSAQDAELKADCLLATVGGDGLDGAEIRRYPPEALNISMGEHQATITSIAATDPDGKNLRELKAVCVKREAVVSAATRGIPDTTWGSCKKACIKGAAPLFVPNKDCIVLDKSMQSIEKGDFRLVNQQNHLPDSPYGSPSVSGTHSNFPY